MSMRATTSSLRAAAVAVGAAALLLAHPGAARSGGAGTAGSVTVERISAALPPDSLLAGGRTVTGIEFAGAHVKSGLALERAIESSLGNGAGVGRRWDGAMLARAVEAILAGYRDAGYLEASIDAVEVIEAGGGVRLRFIIEEGSPSLLAHVDVVGNDLHSDAEIRRLLGLKEGAPFAAAAFRDGIERLLDRYENEGRPFASIEPRDLVWEGGVRLTLAVHEGTPVNVDAIRVSGNRVTRAAVVERIAGLETGEPFVQTRLEQAESRLRRSGLFARIEPIELTQGVDRTRNELLIRVSEGRSNAMQGAVGYAGSGQGLTGLFDLGLGNLAGTGRRASARWEGRGQGVTLYQLRYAEPWILGSPVTGHLGIGRTIQDTLYTRTTWSLGGEMELATDWSLTTGWERETTVQSDGPVRGTARHALLVGGSYDSRDSRWNPTRGLRAATEVRLARKKLRLREEFAGENWDTRVRATLLSGELERETPIGNRWVSVARLRAAGILSDEKLIPFYELYPLGGTTSLRGYREEQFRGSSTVLLQVEQRLLLGEDGSRVAAFVDLGQVSTSGTVLAVPGEPTRTVHIGYGAGLRVATRIGLVGLDYGLGEGDGPLNGKLHVAVESVF